MTSVVAWFGLPVLVLAVALGLGLLGERLARVKLSNALIAPLGACVSVCVVLPVYQLGGTVAIAAPLLCLCAAVGLLLGRRGLRQRLRPGWCALAGAATYAMYIAPVVLSGHWSWLGYNFVNDTANNMIFAAYLPDHGITRTEGPPSSATVMIDSAIGANYPFGSFALLGTLHRLLGVPVEAVYQPLIALLAGLAAVSLAVLARRLGVAGPWAAVIGIGAASASLAYDYALSGAIKEIALVLVLVTAAALAREALDSHWRPGGLALVGVVLAAGLAVFSGGAGAYAAVLAAMLVLAYVLEANRPPARVLLAAGAVGAVAFVVVAAPTLEDSLRFLGTAKGFSDAGGIHGPNSTQILGYLARELPVYQALGVWPADDFRYPLSGVRWTFTLVAMTLACALIAIAVVSELRRRRFGALLVLGPAAVTFLAASPRLGPYAEAKLLMLLSPAAVFAAGIGAWRVGQSPRLRIPALAAAGVLAGGILLSNALAYHKVRLAPTERLEALEDAAEQAPLRGLLLLNEWEEFGKYFARSREINTGSEAFSPRPVVLRDPSVPIFAKSFDLDEIALEYVQSFPSLLVRRSPAASRPPMSFRRVYRNEYYELWLRRPGPRVLEHLPLQGMDDRGAQPRCADVRAIARRAGPGEQLVGIRAAEQPRLDLAGHPPLGWNENGIEGTVTPATPGDPTATVDVDGGRYRAWMRGGSGRKLTLSIDGRAVGSIRGVNTPSQWLPAGEVALAAGVHELRLLRPGGSLAPGDGYAAEIGPVTLEPVREPQPVTVAPGRAEATFCEGRWDWVERIGP